MNTNENTEEKRDEALSFLVNHETGILATASQDGSPHARLLYYTADDSFNVYFLTLANTRKVQELKDNPKAAFVVSQTDIPRTLQIEGSVEDITETATLDALQADFIEKLMTHKPYGIPLQHFDAAVVHFYRLTPSWIRWGDFTFGQGTDAVLTPISPEPEDA